MNLFTVRYPKGHRIKFASYFISGKVQWDPSREVCKTCLLPLHRARTGPYTISWEAGSAVIPDFVGSYTDLIITQRVMDAFNRAQLNGYSSWPVIIKQGSTRAVSQFPVVASPYSGPQLWDVYIDPIATVRLVPERSTITFQGYCQKCGSERWIIPESIDEDDHFFFVDRKSWHGQDFLLPLEINALFITERAAEVIRNGNFSNVEVHRVGCMSD